MLKSLTNLYVSTGWRHFPLCCPFLQGSPWPPVNSHQRSKSRGALMFSLICAWVNSWVNNREAGYLRRHRTYYDVIVMTYFLLTYSVVYISSVPSIIWINASLLRHSWKTSLILKFAQCEVTAIYIVSWHPTWRDINSIMDFTASE